MNAEDELPEFFKLKSDIFALAPDGQVSLTAPLSDTTTKTKKTIRTQKIPMDAVKNNKDDIIVLD